MMKAHILLLAMLCACKAGSPCTGATSDAPKKISPSHSSAEFDLICSGTSLMKVGDGTPDKGKMSERYRIDLVAQRWCRDKCSETRPLVASSNYELQLITNADDRIDAFESLVINRETGALIHHDRIGQASFDAMGSCAVAAFSGFPSPKF